MSQRDHHADYDARQVIDRYLMGKLSAVEEARFEEHYLGCARCLEQLRLAERMQAAMKRAASEDATRLAVGGALTWLAHLSGMRKLMLSGLVAVLLLLPGLWAIRELSVRQEQLAAAGAKMRAALAPQANTPILLLGPTRGTGPPSHVLELAPDTRWAVISLALEPPLAEVYRVILERGDEELWSAAGLVPSPSETLDLSLPASLLPPGDYRLRAETPIAGMAVGEFVFRVTDLR